MTADFLLELRSEEIPARMQAGARNELARLFAQELDKAGLAAESIDVFSTPRRLALIARALPLTTEARSEEIKGPRTSAPPQALEGFLRKTGLSREQLEDRDGTFFAVIDTPGQPMRELLGSMIERIVANFSWPKSMRWGAASASTESLRWIRPLHGIVAMLGEEIVPVAIDGIQSGATTLGHRFHHSGPITLGGPGDYAEKLKACRVIVDQEQRERIIRDGATQAAKAAGLALVADEGLVVENAGLTEWPVPLLGRFDPDYLDVPREVIVLTMRSNQKYFACTGEDGGLAPAFVCVANIEASDGGEAIAQGNARVLAARLADARFFWEQDLKEPLEHQVA
ncbi:MAG TPA: glycine--tRNA ligase subunit beta, partial [Sphingomicrobium sp.]|nr:glycine--tRNA ligase subunit beta [Sphingomicrobium sp.]